MLFNINGVSFSYRGNLILDNVSLTVNEGERVGLIGENGAGKTTLIKLICGSLYPDSGTVTLKNGVSAGLLEQNGGLEWDGTVYSCMLDAVKDRLDAVKRLGELSDKLSQCEYGGREYNVLSAKYESVNKFIAARDCYNAEVNVKTVLGGMGFADCGDQKISTMSGGEKTRLKLARLLLEEPDLLILDEPTNHLDIKTLFWLEDYLSTFKGAVLTVSHDRYFLDRVTQKTAEIENKKLTAYNGSYTKSRQLKAERLALWEKEYKKQQEEIAKLRTYVDKNIVRATTAKSAQSRVKQLDKMELIEKPYVPANSPRFSFTYTQEPYENVLAIENLQLSAGGKSLISGGQLNVKRGSKIAIVGENGTGKSTLLKSIACGGCSGITIGRFVRVAYYDQENANLDYNNTVLDELWQRHSLCSQTDIRARLAQSGLCAEDIDKRVADLSGGERAKLALCILQSEEGNLLLLDEPTNHLDLPARESLEKALREYSGTVIFVSHDRYFISAVAGGIAEIEGGRLNYYNGGYEGYRAQKAAAAELERAAEEERLQKEYLTKKQAGFRSRAERAAEAEKKNRIKQIEADISLAELQESELQAAIADPDNAADYKKLGELCRRLEEVKKRQEDLYAQYEQLID
ncbi:MAG: ATP-binding cassette domain-containing protein [Clostridia bacterium]|nr:ATP-binding cassette domain-containing protein [Clostridia bacterium]